MKNSIQFLFLLIFGGIFITSCMQEESITNDAKSDSIESRSCNYATPCPQVFHTQRDQYGNLLVIVTIPAEIEEACPSNPPTRVNSLWNGTCGTKTFSTYASNVAFDGQFYYVELAPIPKEHLINEVICFAHECPAFNEYLSAMCPNNCPGCFSIF